MRRAQIVVYESDGHLADLLRDSARRHDWWLREVRHADGALQALRPAGAGVLVLKLGRDLERELGLLENVTWLYPDAAAVVVGDVENAPLAELAWDLGARFVLFPPLPRAHLPDIVAGLMAAGRPEGAPPGPTPATEG
jgi:hypothetical protein